jgi:ATP-dependent Lon protease
MIGVQIPESTLRIFDRIEQSRIADMGHWENLGLPTEFDGIVRLFPLPNLVMFPHVIQALHIFEPRYCELLSEALESDRLITMAILETGWESNFERLPRISKNVCIGRVISHTPVGDGRHNILLAGLQRARIIEEIDEDLPFRKAHVQIIQDVPFEDPIAEEAARVHLLNLFSPALPEELAQSDAFSDLLSQQIPLGTLTDVIAYALSFPPAMKQFLLGEHRVVVRYETLVEQLSLLAASKQSNRPLNGQPPPFSAN